MGMSRQVRRHQERQAGKPTHDPRARRAETLRRAYRTIERMLPVDAPGKGLFDGSCNRTDCQIPIAGGNWFNTSTRAYYCGGCAAMINRESSRFDGVVICVSVETEDDKPAFPYDEMRRFQAEREARRAACAPR